MNSNSFGTFFLDILSNLTVFDIRGLKWDLDLVILFAGLFLIALGLVIGLAMKNTLSGRAPERELSRKMKEGSYNDAVRMARELLEAENKKVHGRRDTLYLLHTLASAYEYTGQYANALQFYQEALVKAESRRRDKSHILLAMARVQKKLGKDKEALAGYMIALSEDPGMAEALYEMAALQYARKNVKKARETLERLLKKRPGLLDARFLYGQILFEGRSYTQALRQFEFLSRHDQHDYRVHLYKARIYEGLKRYTDALKTYRFVLESDWDRNGDESFNHELEQSRVSVIELCIKLKDYYGGIQYVSEYLKSDSSDAVKTELIYLYANLLYNTGEEYKALKQFERVYLMNPDYKDVRLLYERFKKIFPQNYLDAYFTADAPGGGRDFEAACRKIIGLRKNFELLYRHLDFFIFSRGGFFVVFYRHIEPIPYSRLTDIQVLLDSYPQKPQNVEIYSLSGVRDDAVTHMLLRSAHIVEGDDFLSAVRGE